MMMRNEIRYSFGGGTASTLRYLSGERRLMSSRIEGEAGQMIQEVYDHLIGGIVGSLNADPRRARVGQILAGVFSELDDPTSREILGATLQQVRNGPQTHLKQVNVLGHLDDISRTNGTRARRLTSDAQRLLDEAFSDAARRISGTNGRSRM